MVRTPGTLLSLGIAAILANADDPPWLAPVVADAAPWLFGPAVAFGLVSLVGRDAVANYVRPA
jgi:hypothetical protein